MCAIRPFAAPVLALCVLSAATEAQVQIQQISDSFDIPVMITNWMEPASVDQFDPSLGTLLSITLTTEASVTGAARVENTDNLAALVTINYSSAIEVRRQDNNDLLLVANPTFMTNINLSSYDGTTDFVGTSGESFNNLAANDSTLMTFTMPFSADVMNLFVGTGSINLDVSASGSSFTSGAGNLVAQFETNAAATVTVTYEYEGIVDCNMNGIPDDQDINRGSADCDMNEVPDECDPDCNDNDIPDACDPTPCPCLEFNRRQPGSLLLFPEYQNGPGRVTVFTITNGNCSALTGTTTIEFRYINEANCSEANQTATLSPCDTLSLLTSSHTGQNEGYAYVYAKSNIITPANPNGEPLSFNHLIGQFLVVDGFTSFDYSANAVAFKAIAAQGLPTDTDGIGGGGDGIRDLDNVEYEPAPDKLYIPRFLGQDPINPAALGSQGLHSELVLVNLSGGAAFAASPAIPGGGTLVSIIGYNDNEVIFSTEYLFSCWDKVKLAEINGAFLNSNLGGIGSNPFEIEGAEGREAGWFKLDGFFASSTVESIFDPAIYAFLIEHIRNHAVADLPFEFCSQVNGDLLPIANTGDFPFVIGDNE